MTHQSIIENWQKAAEVASDRGYRFLRWLKLLDHKKVDRIAKETHTEVFAAVNCLQCTNCCRTLKPEFREKDQRAISVHLDLTVKDLRTTYLEQNEQGVWQTNALPCPFLADTGHCRIYAVRPGDCSGFPHTDQTSFASRSWSHSANTENCPAVFAILERMQVRMRYRDRG